MSLSKYILLAALLCSGPTIDKCVGKDVEEERKRFIRVYDMFMNDIAQGTLPESSVVKNSIPTKIDIDIVCNNHESDYLYFVYDDNKEECGNYRVIAYSTKDTDLLYAYCVESKPYKIVSVYKRKDNKWIEIYNKGVVEK